MAGSLWMKLDWNWREDPDVMEFEDDHGKAALVDLIQLWCVLSEFYGELDMNNRGQRLKAQKRMGMNREELESFIDKVAERGLINKSAWIATRKVGSKRSLKDGANRKSRVNAANTASDAAKEKRANGTP